MCIGRSGPSESTASTTIVAKKALCPETSLDESEVAACRSSMERSVESEPTGIASSSTLESASAHACAEGAAAGGEQRARMSGRDAWRVESGRERRGEGGAAYGAECLDDDLRVHAVLDERLGLAQKLARQHDHRGGAVAHLGVLRARDVDERLRGRVHDIEQLHERRAVV